MISVNCHTNLDLMPAEKWPQYMPAVPRVGDAIVSAMKWDGGFQLTLYVVAIKWKRRGDKQGDQWEPCIELHMGDGYMYKKYDDEGKYVCMSIYDFYNWYAPKVGQRPSLFI